MSWVVGTGLRDMMYVGGVWATVAVGRVKGGRAGVELESQDTVIDTILVTGEGIVFEAKRCKSAGLGLYMYVTTMCPLLSEHVENFITVAEGSGAFGRRMFAVLALTLFFTSAKTF